MEKLHHLHRSLWIYKKIELYINAKKRFPKTIFRFFHSKNFIFKFAKSNTHTFKD